MSQIVTHKGLHVFNEKPHHRSRQATDLNLTIVALHSCDKFCHPFTFAMKPAVRYHCEQCGKSYGTTGHLNRHMRVHTGERPYKCDQCDKSFMRKDHLDDHYSSHTDYRPFACKRCHMKFYTKQKLNRHETLHDRPKRYVCEQCREAFFKKNQLARHSVQHTGKLPFPCPEPDCEQAFSMPSGLKRHQEQRHSLSTYVCLEPNCSADPFTKFSQLQRHLKCHRAVQSHECDKCGKRFSNASSLKKHRPTHELPIADRMIHKCHFPGCKAAYTSSGNLGTHVRSKHLNREAFGCEHCSARFSVKSSYERHVRNLHGDGLNKKELKFFCRICNIGNPSRAALRRHMRMEHKMSAYFDDDKACQSITRKKSNLVTRNEDEQRTCSMIASPPFLDNDKSSARGGDDNESGLKATTDGPSSVSPETRDIETHSEINRWDLQAEAGVDYCVGVGSINNFGNQIQSKRQELELPSETPSFSAHDAVQNELPLNPETEPSIKPRQRFSTVLV